MSQSDFEETVSETAEETPREQFERERLTRRAALAKIGIRAGATAFALFSIDDLARYSIARMKEHQSMRQVADVVGREFRDAGVAFAEIPAGYNLSKGQCGSPASIYNYCRYHFHQDPAEQDPLTSCQDCCKDIFHPNNVCAGTPGSPGGNNNPLTESERINTCQSYCKSHMGDLY